MWRGSGWLAGARSYLDAGGGADSLTLFTILSCSVAPRIVWNPRRLAISHEDVRHIRALLHLKSVISIEGNKGIYDGLFVEIIVTIKAFIIAEY